MFQYKLSLLENLIGRIWTPLFNHLATIISGPIRATGKMGEILFDDALLAFSRETTFMPLTLLLGVLFDRKCSLSKGDILAYVVF